MDEQITPELNASDHELFVDSFVEQISGRYPFSTAETARAILSCHHAGRDRFGFFSKRKTIWKTTNSRDICQGFTVVTEKRGGSIKFGPTIVFPKYQNSGVGSRLRSTVESHYRDRGYRKAYSTTNLRNAAGIYYLTKIGYRIELHLRSHYEQGKDELVLSKLLIPGSREAIPKRAPAECAGLQSQAESRFYADLQFDFEEIDDEFFKNLRASLEVTAPDTEQAFVQKARRLLSSANDHSISVAVPKRGSCVKLFPLIMSSIDADTNELLSSAWGTFPRAHKLYTLVPAKRWAKVEKLKSFGFVTEGLISEPYKTGVDVVVLATWRGAGQ